MTDIEIRNLTPVPIGQVTIEDAFWSPKFQVWRNVTIADCFTKFENDRGGALNNFDQVRDGTTGKHAGPPWYDGLIYEMIRGCADFLAAECDPVLEARIDGYIDRIAAAQQADPTGYLNTWTQSMAPQEHRWGRNGGDDRWQHDVYNAGMLVEAAVHYWRATGKPALLEVATRLANMMCDLIGPAPKFNVVPGHSGPEEALVQLYLLYRDSKEARSSVSVPVTPERYLALAEFFIDGRGHFEGRTGKDPSFYEYGQDHAPLNQQTTLEGHAVRATLFGTGIVAAAQVNQRADYLAAAHRFWESLANHKLYISGAAGAIEDEEKLGPDHFLPNDGYMETCAAVGVGFFGRNMNLLTGKAGYIDELERALYNAALGGTSLSGDHYYYQNPLVGDGHQRWEWHSCPCCPPMFLKLMGALPGYIYAQDRKSVYVNLFIGSRTNLIVQEKNVELQQSTEYPWDGKVTLTLTPEKPVAFDLMIRLPNWVQPGPTNALYRAVKHLETRCVSVRLNGQTLPYRLERGYICLRRIWNPGDVVELTLEMPVRQVVAHPEVEAVQGQVALMRGPILYCVEEIDNPGGIDNIAIGPDTELAPVYRPELLGGVVTLQGEGITAVPFYASGNREPGALRVWLPASPPS